ncbi:hypothetical protein JM47_03315 [Ureaplasma diversum]|uniref:HMA domain-containing protein n=2 Tax=Ureaplasma diversum TaxID=42094 RepID=A0A084EYB5_9BACT|nr:heavy-metal-associated domain-containing protein [Ureaplasma diversum]AJQ45563.1 hypothetical protein JM47_03315 [Ureaplasma diversum]KEZ22957.1 hypothetical protein UDIV_4530 [Ureaplasma diversum NCTC 246]
MTYLLLTSSNMHCGSCATNIRDALKEFELSNLNVNILSNEIEVEFDENNYQIQQILDSLSKHGFSSEIVEQYKY